MTAVHAACRGGLDCRLGGRARGGAHPEHVAHGCDAGGVEAQRLVERRRALPRVERRASVGGRAAGREVAGGGRPQRANTACTVGLDCRLGDRTGVELTWNISLMNLTLEVSKLSGWLNAAAFCRE